MGQARQNKAIGQCALGNRPISIVSGSVGLNNRLRLARWGDPMGSS